MTDPQPRFELPLVDASAGPANPVARRPLRALALHTLRIAMFVTTLVMVRLHYQRQLEVLAATQSAAVAIDDVQAFFPDAAKISDAKSGRASQTVLSVDGTTLGYVVQTSPQCDAIIGFSGPTNVLIAFDTDDRVVSADVLWSRDTREHLDMILDDGRLLAAWNGLTWDELSARLTSADAMSVDAVSGATLTSLAIVESVALRLTGQRPTSLRFPDELTLEEVTDFYPDAGRLTGGSQPTVLDKDGNELGYVLRTSPAADNITGYQGPTDTLIACDADDRILGIRLRQSFDNDKYVGYVRNEDYFLALFNGKTLAELAELDLFEAQVEGVSGATMTSMAVADGLVAAAKDAIVSRTKSVAIAVPRERSVNVTWRTIASSLIVLTGVGMGFLPRLFRRGLSRRIFQVAVIGLLGIVNGDLVSQAILVGWAQNGIPWQLAPGLVIVTVAALIVPMVSRQQPYCQHICPHGAAQQLLIHRIPRQWKLPVSLHKVLSPIPFLLLLTVVIIAMTGLPVSLVDLEPFDAWVIGLAGASAATIAIVGLVTSLFVPMAYCRYGCPTGALLQFLRYHSRSDRFTRQDAAAAVLTAVAIACV